MLLYWVWLSQLKLSLLQKHRLLWMFGSPEELYRSSGRALTDKEGMTQELAEVLEDKDLTRAQQILQECRDKGIGVVGLDDSAYPARLRNITDAPLVLYVKGKLPDWNRQPVIGIVGTRRATPYGLRTAMRFGEHIASCGALVISGGASGIDTKAMEGAMKAGRPVVGVLGCGVDIVYPSENKLMFEKVIQDGCLISEYPPRTRATKWSFPARNRIISGISNGLLVVEAPLNSGSLNTARHALEQGRDVFVVPGGLDTETFSGSNQLFREGAIPAFNGWDVLRDYAPLWEQTVTQQPEPKLEITEQPVVEEPPKPAHRSVAADKKAIDKEEKSTYSVINIQGLSPQEQQIVSLLQAESTHLDQLVDGMAMPASAVKSLLTKMSIKGLVQLLPGGRVRLK